MVWRLTFPIMSLLMLVLMSALAKNQAQAQHVFNIKDFGAVGDGKTDCQNALSDAWKGACRSNKTSVVLIPDGTYLLDTVTLKGPCNGSIEFQIQGDLKALDSPQLGVDHWITIRHVDNLTIAGGGSLDGQGAASWPYNDCLNNSNCKKLPVTMRLDFVTNAHIHHVTSLNSKNFHFNLFSCKDVTLEHVTITAPEDSINTDGIHMALSSNISIRDSRIGTGDDCISLGPGSENINMTGIACGPGHGISIGSLGISPNESRVAMVFLGNSIFKGTTNGLRIKTRVTSNEGTVTDITYQDIIVKNVTNPIFIDQIYCPGKDCQGQTSKVQISDVRFKNVTGTSSSLAAVTFNCSSAAPCTGIELRDIDLEYGGGDEKASSVCVNAKGASYGTVNPPSCLKSSALHSIHLI